MDNNKIKNSFEVQEEASDPKLIKTLAKVKCQARPGESLVLEVPSWIESFVGGNHKCTVVVTNQRLIFWDHSDMDFSFELSRADLEHSTIRRYFGRHLKIKTMDGTEHLIHLEKGNVERLVAAIGKDLPPNTHVKDVVKVLLCILIFIAWFGGGAFLADAYHPEYDLVIIGIVTGIPMLLFGFFLGRAGTLFVIFILAIVAVWNAIEGTYPLWAGGVALLVCGGISFLGQVVRAFVRKES